MMPSPFQEEEAREFEEFIDATGTDPYDDNVDALFEEWLDIQSDLNVADIVSRRGDD